MQTFLDVSKLVHGHSCKQRDTILELSEDDLKELGYDNIPDIEFRHIVELLKNHYSKHFKQVLKTAIQVVRNEKNTKS